MLLTTVLCGSPWGIMGEQRANLALQAKSCIFGYTAAQVLFYCNGAAAAPAYLDSMKR